MTEPVTEEERIAYHEWVDVQIATAKADGVELIFKTASVEDVLDPEAQSWIFDGTGGVWVSDVPGGVRDPDGWHDGWDWLMNDWSAE